MTVPSCPSAMPRTMLLLGTALFLSIIVCSTNCTLVIGSFNVQRLGTSKATNATIVNNIVQILRNFDIAVILEVLDSDAINIVVQALNKIFTSLRSKISRLTNGFIPMAVRTMYSNKLEAIYSLKKQIVQQSRNYGPYSLKLSTATGSTTYKEHVAILYRNDKLSAVQAREFPDRANELERKPYTVLFHTTQTGVTTFGVTGVHLKPTAVVREMRALVKVYNDASKAFQTQNILIAGDFNADCSYLSDRQYTKSKLYTDTRFTFLINKDADTTTGNTNCAYDRFVVAGSQLRAAVVTGSARAIAFPKTLGLTDTQAKAVSDHYPIEMKIR